MRDWIPTIGVVVIGLLVIIMILTDAAVRWENEKARLACRAHGGSVDAVSASEWRCVGADKEAK